MPGELRCGPLGGLAICTGTRFELVLGGATCDGDTRVSCGLLGAASRQRCDDGQFCNRVETCSGTACRAGTAPCGRADLCSEAGDLGLSCANDGDCPAGQVCDANACRPLPDPEAPNPSEPEPPVPSEAAASAPAVR